MKKPKTKSEIILPRSLGWMFALLTVVIVPLLYYKQAVDVSLVPKLVGLSLSLLLFAGVLLLFPKYRIPFTTLFRVWPVRLWAGLGVITLLSLVVAINPAAGVLDVLRLFTSLVFLVFMAGILIRGDNLRPFLISALLLALIYSCVGYYEYFTHVFRTQDLNMLYKVNGLMSHKNIFSAALFLTTPFLCYILFTFPTRERVFGGIVLFLNLTLLFLVQTRSVWLALIVFLLTLIILVPAFRVKFTAGSKNFWQRSGILGGVLLVAFVSAFFINRYSVSHSGQAQEGLVKEKIENLDTRVASIFSTQSPNRIKRIDIWERTGEIILDNPWLGVGAGNWKIAVPAYFKPDPDESFYHNWDRPHNDYLWVLAEKGVLGIVIYLGFFISLLVISLQALRKNITAEQKLLVILMLGGLAGYCVDALFSFPYERIETQILMMMFAAVILWVRYRDDQKERSKESNPKRSALLITAVALLVTTVIGFQIISAEKHINIAHEAFITQQWALMNEQAELARSPWINLDPVNNPFDWYSGNAQMQLGNLQEAKANFEQALVCNPNSVSTLGDLGIVYYLLKDYPKAISYFKQALIIFPMNRGALQYLGRAYYDSGQYKEGLDCFYDCLTDKPNPELEALIKAAEAKVYGPPAE